MGDAFSRSDARSVLVQVAIGGQIGYCFVVLLLTPVVCNRQRTGGTFPGSRSGLGGTVGAGRLFGQPLETAESTHWCLALHVSEPTRPPLLLLIELIFCLGSIWAKLELAFLASVIDYSMISIRLLPSNTCLPTSLLSFSYMDQMNHTCNVM